MDVLEELSKKIKADWDLDTQKRKIYIELCKLFSYDTRLHFMDLLGEKGINQKIEIINQEVNIKNVTDFNVSCGTFSKHFHQACLELLGEESNMVGDGHRYVIFDSCNGYGPIKADATLGDLTRVKLGVETKGYRYLKLKKKSTKLEEYEFNLLSRIDHEIGYIKFFYKSLVLMLLNGPSLSGCIPEQVFLDGEDRDTFTVNYLLSQIKNEEEAYSQILNNFANTSYADDDDLYLDILKKYYESQIINSILNETEAFQLKICQKTSELFNKNYNFTNFDDALYVLNYLFRITLDKYDIIQLFQESSNSDWQYLGIFKLNFSKINIYLLLHVDEQGIYKLDFQNEKEIKDLTRSYKGNNKKKI